MTDNNRERLLLWLFEAYFAARRNKRNTMNQLRFELSFEAQLVRLLDELESRTYRPGRSIAFVIDRPVKREVLAADFRDRVVHHLLFNLINPIFEPDFIEDSFSCRKGKGTLHGVRTLERAVKECSNHYSRDCYVLKLDIMGYFMSIDKHLLRAILAKKIEASEQLDSFSRELSLYVIETLLTDNPTDNCIIRGSAADWAGLPASKSLFHAAPDCGLPIGNLTSQLFSNIYLNEFDQFVKCVLGIRHYGRYVDDFYVVHTNPSFLRGLIRQFDDFLRTKLHLKLHPGKIFLQHYTKGVNFLGATVKPHRSYVSNRTKHNFLQTVRVWEQQLKECTPHREQLHGLRASINSYLGILRHHRTYNIRRDVLIDNQPKAFLQYGYLESVKYKYMVYRLYHRNR
jgi:RNA-directed DNA polymerase